MFLEGSGQPLVESDRLDQGIEERLGILAVQAHDFVRGYGIFSMRQGTGQDKTADRFSLETRGTLQYLLRDCDVSPMTAISGLLIAVSFHQIAITPIRYLVVSFL